MSSFDLDRDSPMTSKWPIYTARGATITLAEQTILSIELFFESKNSVSLTLKQYYNLTQNAANIR